MKTRKIRVISAAAFVVLLGAWTALFCTFKDNSLLFFPGLPYETFALTDAPSGGYSTSDISLHGDTISAKVNIRSGMAYPYAGIGVNLMSVDHRPAASQFDFSKFDTIAVSASAGRMKSLTLRILTDDPQYTREGEYLSYRPLLATVPVSPQASETKLPLSSFAVPERWLVMNGLDHDDGFTYWNRAVFFEISNGEGALRGIPDEFEIYSIRMYGLNRGFVNAMYTVLAFIIAAFLISQVLAGREGSRKKKDEKEKSTRKQMAEAARLLKTTDRSIAEIAIAVGEKNVSAFERKFRKEFGKKPLAYRRENA